MKIKHTCGHFQEWNPPEHIVKNYTEKMLEEKKYLESIICHVCAEEKVDN